MNKRELVMLAHDYNPEKHNVNGWYASEKLDGQRALWLPHTRGLPIASIPFANRERDHREHVATGLWSRYAKPIQAPTWFLDQLPRDFNLDGELWAGRGSFQLLSSAVRKLVPLDHEWLQVRYLVIDMPPDAEFWKVGRVYTPNYKYVFDGQSPWEVRTQQHRDFPAVLHYLGQHLVRTEHVDLHAQEQLDFGTTAGLRQMEAKLDAVVAGGGEGLILRHYNLTWEPTRSHQLVKVKPILTSKCIVKGWTAGKGKLLGMFGALKVLWEGKIFELSGFTNLERTLAGDWPRYFPLDMEIEFMYRELSDDGIPKEARFKRPG